MLVLADILAGAVVVELEVGILVVMVVVGGFEPGVRMKSPN